MAAAEEAVAAAALVVDEEEEPVEAEATPAINAVITVFNYSDLVNTHYN